MAAYLANIFVYPIKSLDGVAVETATIAPAGALAHDRRFAMLDDQGRFINGKRNARVHGLRSTFDAAFTSVTLQVEGTPRAFEHEWVNGTGALAEWLSEYFEQPVHIEENAAGGLPDDTDAPGPTVISAATIREVASWLPGVDEQQMRRRLRPNLVIEGVPAFWEDGLYGDAGTVVGFRIGDVQIEGVNPCQRCVVPSRDPVTGEPIDGFRQTVMSKRKQTLPKWANRSRFNHFYRLSVNTRIPVSEVGRALYVGDEVLSPGHA